MLDPELTAAFAGAESKKAKTHSKKVLNNVAELLERNGIGVEDVGAVTRVNIHQRFYKDEDGKAQVMDVTGVTLSPKWADGPEWPVVQQAKPTVIRRSKVVKTKPESPYKVAVVLPDPQIGYWRDIDTMELDPFHDEAAIDVALQVTADIDPDRIINLGDTVDFAEFSRFPKEMSFALTTQAGVDYAHSYLARQRAIVSPDATIDLIEGNHDARITKLIQANAAAAMGLRQANIPDAWPVMSIPHLLRLDELGVTYHSGYPASRVWLNNRLFCIHGHRVKSGGSTAALVVEDEKNSVIFGHVHRRERQDRTVHTREGPRTRTSITPGCLCRTDGVVPSTKGGYDILGRPISNFENWQQGFAVVTYVEGDGEFEIEMVSIHNGVAIYRGKRYEATAGLLRDSRSLT